MSKKPKTGVVGVARQIQKPPSYKFVVRPIGSGFGAFDIETGRLIAGGNTEHQAMKRAGRKGWHLHN